MAAELAAWFEDCMTRVFSGRGRPEKPARKTRVLAAGNEYACFQVVIGGAARAKMVCGEAPEGVFPADAGCLSARVGAMAAADGRTIPGEAAEVLFAENVPLHWHDGESGPGDIEGVAPGFYPDPLLPFIYRRWVSPDPAVAWVRVRVPEGTGAGVYRGRVEVNLDGEGRHLDFEIEVLPFSLPARTGLLMTNWLFVGQLLRFHRVEPMSPEFWEVVGMYARNLSAHRQNVIFTPLFRFHPVERLAGGRLAGQLVDIVEEGPGKYSFDFANFDRWAKIFLGAGFEMLEGTHLAARSSVPAVVSVRRPGREKAEAREFPSTTDAAYRLFLGQFLAALERHLAGKGWLGRYCQHVSDEPGQGQLEAYSDLAGFARRHAPGLKLIDAMGRPEFASCVDYPVPLVSRYESFLEKSGVPARDTWFYYCMGPRGPWPNRFLDYPLSRVRIFTWLAFRYRIPGFLHWGLNYWGWHPGAFREEECNPWDNVTGGSLPGGDSHVLYPPRMPSVSREPVDSIRWEIIRKAMEDYEYLAMLEKLVAEGRGGAADLEAGRALLRELAGEIAPDFTGYTRDARRLEDFRERVARTIARLLPAGEKVVEAG